MDVRRAARPLLRLLAIPEWCIHAVGSRPAGFPDFLGIGVPKAGTTWLHENLKMHPNVFLPDKKELHFFDQRWHRPVRRYLEHFRVSEAEGATIGEITPSYCTLGVGRVRWIRRLNPDTRLLVMLRNPAEQAWSHIMMHEYWNAARPEQALEMSPQDLLRRIDTERVRDRTEHAAFLRRWMSVFPRDQFFVGRYERISSDPEGLLSEVLDFLDVTPPTDWSPYPLRSFFNKGKGPSLPPAFRKLLKTHYADSIRDTQELLDVDLRAWLP